MEDNYISISTLNDFIFCPYSIYLHNVYIEADEGLYHATPQTRGRFAHETVDSKKASNRADDLQSFPVLSEEYGLMGKIDIYKGKEHKLIERKYQLKNIYQGQIYQLWGQYLCMKEMGYDVKSIALRPVFYWADSAEAIFLIRQRQYAFDKDDISIARIIVANKIANHKVFSEKDFAIYKGEYRLKLEYNKVYSQVFFDSIVPYKLEIFRYVQSYYRCFMGKKSVEQYPKFYLL